MSFTYDEANLATNAIARVRMATGQVTDDGGVSDEVITYIMSTYTTDIEAKTISKILSNLLVQAAQMYDRTTGQVSESQSQIYKNLKDLLTVAQVGLSAAVPVCMHFGGVNREEFDARNNDKSVYQGFQTQSAEVGSDANNGVTVDCDGVVTTV